jgi:hypothetical protein
VETELATLEKEITPPAAEPEKPAAGSGSADKK